MKRSPLTAILVLGLMAAGASAQTVAWGTSYSDVPASYLSDGTADVGVLTWTLGYFNTGYTPTASNYDSWVANWNQVASQTYHQDPGTSEYVALQSYASGDPGDPPEVIAARGQVMWIFAYNTTAEIGSETGQALLFTQNTTFPGQALSKDFDIQNTAGNTEDDDFNIVWGRVDRDWLNLNAGEVKQGGGVYGSFVPDSTESGPSSGYGTFEAQAGGWSIVPESSTSLLGLLGSTLLLKRRRRQG